MTIVHVGVWHGGAHFRNGEWLVDMPQRVVSKDSLEHHLSPRAMAVLGVLLSNAGEVVTRTALLDEVWHGMIVTDDVLTQCIYELRATSGDRRTRRRYIKTIPKKGYVLIAAVTPVAKSRGEPVPLLARRWASLVAAL